MKKLEGKVAVVAGASKGIGASIAEHLAAEGASVVVNYASSRAGAEGVATRIKEKGGTAIVVRGNLAAPKDIQHLFSVTRNTFGKVDILVNNAGAISGARSTPPSQDNKKRRLRHEIANVRFFARPLSLCRQELQGGHHGCPGNSTWLPRQAGE